MSGLSIVWFKRDLRVEDHRPLASAATAGNPVRCIFIFEPSIWQQPDFARIHDQFIRDSLQELDRELRIRGGGLEIFGGDALDVLKRIHQNQPIAQIFSHEETGNGATYSRDRQVLAWCKTNRILWHETPTNGVVRRLADRDGWAKNWEARMAEPQTIAPPHIPGVPPPPMHLPKETTSPNEEIQRGGIYLAKQTLEDFLNNRGIKYSGGISSPLSASSACSRLSPYLTFGNLSSRQVLQATRRRIADLDPAAKQSLSWKRSLRSFDQRLHWRCHFVQKLESEPAIEHHNFVRALDGLREDDFNQDHYDAWCNGITGFPLIDACMRSMRCTGWINFRMRAMLVSFASYQLWLHWKPTATFAACQWLDYEPGIHYSQFQMQSGTTGINTLRIYNPIKQALDHDPAGTFIRRWVPELELVPEKWIHTPWLMPDEVQASLGLRIGKFYPKPIVDHFRAIAQAKKRISEFRRNHPEFWEEAKAVHQRHGSRRRNPTLSSSKSARMNPSQGSLFS